MLVGILNQQRMDVLDMRGLHANACLLVDSTSRGADVIS